MSAALTLAKAIGIKGAIGILASLVLGTLFFLQQHKTHVAEKAAASWQQKYDGEHAALVGTVANYRAAAQQAAAADKANAERVRVEQAAINKRTTNEYEARLASARAAAGRLRQQLAQAAAHPGSPAAAGVSGPDAAPGSPHGPAAEDGFSVDDRLTATEQAIQLDELIKWVRANVSVSFSGAKK